MNNQEMQFSDPEWRPQQGNVNMDEQEPYIPQPINTDPREQPQQQTPLSEQERAYEGYAPYSSTQREKIGVGPYAQRPRRRGRPLLWLIVILIAFALLGRIATPFYGSHDFGPHHMQQTLKSVTYSVNADPTIVINDPFGTIDVHAGGSANTVSINPGQEGDGFGNAAQVNYQHNGNTINVTVDENGPGSFGSGGVNLDITVPINADLQIHTGSGDIQVSGVNGQMSLETGNGDIEVSQDTLSGQSTLRTGRGDIHLDSSLDPNGNYRLQTGLGDINVTLPGNSSVHVDAITGLGDVTSGFTEVSVQSTDNHQAHGDIGNAPRAELSLQTGSGDISLDKQ
jgi:hypothetical protein